MVMQLHSFLQEHPDATMEQIDNILDGNLCRWMHIPHFYIPTCKETEGYSGT